jgi:hypothetical protein
MFNKYSVIVWTGCHRLQVLLGFFEYGIEPLDSIEDWEFINEMNVYQLLKKLFTQWSWLTSAVLTNISGVKAVRDSKSTQVISCLHVSSIPRAGNSN